MKELILVIRRISKSLFMKNTVWLILEHVFRMSLSIVVTGMLARYLGSSQFGVINYGLAFISIFTIICKLGIDSILVNEIINHRDITGKILGTTIILRLITSLLSVIAIYLLVRITDPSNYVIHKITLIQSFSLLFVSFDVVSFWFQANLQSKYPVVAKSVAFVMASIWRVYLIGSNAELELFAFATIIEAVFISASVLLFYILKNGQKLEIDLRFSKELTSRGYHFLIAGLLITVYTQMDKIMLGRYSEKSMVGIYTAAVTIAGFWTFIPNAIIESAKPIIVSAKNVNNDLFVRRITQLFSVVIWISIVAAIVITILSKTLILSIFGNEYINASYVLPVLVWSRIFSLIGVTRSIWLLTENKTRFQKYFVGLGAIVNLFLNIILIPKYGAFGAAIGTIFAEITSSTFALLMFTDTRPLLKIILNSIVLKDT